MPEKTSSHILQDKCIKWLTRNKDSTSWFPFFHLHYFISTVKRSRSWKQPFKINASDRLDALFLQDLINIIGSSNTVTREINGDIYTLCTTEFLERSRGRWSEHEQKQRFDSLRRWGFVETVRKGIPTVRWVFIDFIAIEQAIDQAEELLKSTGGFNPPTDTGNSGNSSGVKTPSTGGLKPRPLGVLTPRKKNNSKEEQRKGEGGPEASPRSATPPEPHTSNGKDTIGKVGTRRLIDHGDSSQNGNSNGKHSASRSTTTHKATWKTADTLHAAAARQLHKALREGGRVVDGHSNEVWSSPLKNVISADPEYQKVLDWFCKNCSRELSQKHGLPTITNGKQYHSRYEWVRDCYDKSRKPKGWTKRSTNVLDGDDDAFETREEWI